VGYLYTRVEAFVRERESSAGVGMIEQSLCHHIHGQLTEYYRLIAILESQMSSLSAGRDGAGEHEGVNLTLKRLDVWINEWRLRMRMMSVCVEGARGENVCGECFCLSIMAAVQALTEGRL
jgi:gamma-tubulin complex component 3